MTVLPVAARAAATRAGAARASGSGRAGQRLRTAASAYTVGKGVKSVVSRDKPAKSSTSSGSSSSGPEFGGASRKLLVAEFTLCMVILAFSPITDKHKSEKPGAFMKRASATMGVFFVLGLISTAGRGAGKAAAAFGGLMTLTLLISQRSIFTVLTGKLNKGVGESSGVDDDDTGRNVGGPIKPGSTTDDDDDFGQSVPDAGLPPVPSPGGLMPLFPNGIGLGAGFR